MKQLILITLVLILGVVGGVMISSSNAQQQTPGLIDRTCKVGESSNAACAGNWIIFAGNTSGVDSGAWVVRMNGESGEVWYKNGKRLVLLNEPD